MKKYFLFSLIIFSTILALPVYAEVSSSGFIPGQIWYSKEPLVEGETVNIHTAVWNGEKDPLSAKVEFYDKNVILGSRDVVLTTNELKDVYVPWKITSGDHVISAKIISSSATISGKKENIVLERIATGNNKQFVSVVVKNDQGKTVSGESALQDQIKKTTTEINNIVPEKVSSSISNSFAVVDDFRDRAFTQIEVSKKDTQQEINLLNQPKDIIQTINEKSNVNDATKKPIAYVKLFLLTALAFILGNKIVFYGILIFVVFLILRFIYRKIRNK